MIEISDKHLCCGCEACAQACPVGCITMTKDPEGFMYPAIDNARCIKCGKCVRVCPGLQSGKPHTPLATYAMQNSNNSVRKTSSSGGVFSLLAENVLAENGVVFGARFTTSWDVEHYYTETSSGLKAMLGSKYLQSRIGDCYKRTHEFLIQGREVLFSGTPCQIAGLTNFLGKRYDNLTIVSIVCHSVASPAVWTSFVNENYTPEKITHINFRDKTNGWKNYNVTIGDTNQSHHESPYMRTFLERLSIRQSCSQCPAKCGKSATDIILGDLWGIDVIKPDLDDDIGTSLAIAYSLVNDVNVLSGHYRAYLVANWKSVYSNINGNALAFADLEKMPEDEVKKLILNNSDSHIDLYGDNGFPMTQFIDELVINKGANTLTGVNLQRVIAHITFKISNEFVTGVTPDDNKPNFVPTSYQVFRSPKQANAFPEGPVEISKIDQTFLSELTPIVLQPGETSDSYSFDFFMLENKPANQPNGLTKW